MRNLVIYNQYSRASLYGIGTYQDQILSLVDRSQYKVIIVYLNSNCGEFHIESKSDRLNVYVPSPVLRENARDLDQSLVYVKNSLYLLHPLIGGGGRHIFLLNYIYDVAFTNCLRELYPAASVVLAIHYLDWFFKIRYNEQFFDRIIAEQGSLQSTDLERGIYQTYLSNKQFMNSLDRVVCLSKSMKRLLIEKYGVNAGNLHVIYNGLKDRNLVYYDQDYIDNLKLKYGFNSKDRLLLFVGRVDEDKGVFHLIKAFKMVLEKHKRVKLVIMGDGRIGECVSTASPAWSNIIFTGAVDKCIVSDFYMMSDIGVIPSYYEQCSYVAIEMMMYGLPVIGTDSSGLDEMVQEHVNGRKIYIEKEGESVCISESDLSGIISSILSMDLSEYRDMRNNSRRMYLDRYSIDSMKREYLSLFEDLP